MVIEYTGNKFELLNSNSVVDVEPLSEEVWIPEYYNGTCITAVDFDDVVKKFKGIRVLHISSKIEKICLGKVVFPDLEEVTVDPANQHFIVRDGMLLSDNGKTLVRCIVCKGDSIVLPEKITRISSIAFYGTEFSKIIFPKSNFTVENSAFEGSKWQTLQHGTIIVGDLFFKADTSNGTLVVPESVHKLHQNIIGSQELLHTVVCNTNRKLMV